MLKKRLTYNTHWHDLAGYSILTLLFWFVGSTPLSFRLSQLVFTTSAPLLRFEMAVGSAISFPVKNIISNLDKQERIVQLSTEVSRLNARVLELELIEKENAQLRLLLENTDRKQIESRIASPLVSLAYPAVAAGAEQGLHVGDTVLVSGTLVGIITEVLQSQSKVALLSQTSVPPTLATTESGVEGLVVGNGRLVQLTQIPRDATLRVGERVVTTGQEGIAKNLFIGRIARIEESDSAPTKTAVIEQVVRFYDALVVEVQ